MEEEEGRKTEGNGVDERVRRWKRRKGERQKGMEWTKGEEVRKGERQKGMEWTKG